MTPFAFGTPVSLLVLQAAASTTDDGLTAGEILDSIPFDPASVLAYLLMAVFVFGVLWFGTRSGGTKGGAPPA
jgi:hypothetical protein